MATSGVILFSVLMTRTTISRDGDAAFTGDRADAAELLERWIKRV